LQARRRDGETARRAYPPLVIEMNENHLLKANVAKLVGSDIIEKELVEKVKTFR
jgi:chromosome condensin MukBEF MukE localization factor